eukprot:362411-Chlamydomonas_euryale.AAC.5
MTWSSARHGERGECCATPSSAQPLEKCVEVIAFKKASGTVNSDSAERVKVAPSVAWSAMGPRSCATNAQPLTRPQRMRSRPLLHLHALGP